MSQADAYEQYILELINAERVKAGVQPLVFDDDLNEAAENHSRWMLDSDIFSHTGASGSNAGQRMSGAGYVFSGSWAWGENIARASTRAPVGLQDEAALLHTNLMNSTGHRQNLLNGIYREIGLGFEVGDYQGRESTVLTEDFARTTSKPFLTGVAFDDKDGDRTYDVGEGLGGVTVTATNTSSHQSFTAISSSAGGYNLELGAGSYQLAFAAPGLASTTKAVAIGTSNVKVDWIDPAASGGTPAPPPAPASGGGTLTGTSGNDKLTGTAGNDTIEGLGGNDTIDGLAGADMMRGSAGSDQYYVENVGDQVIELAGHGTDLVNAYIGYTLPDHVENLFLRGSANTDGNGNAFNNRLEGSDGINKLFGLAGHDMLIGRGGADELTGGAGSDIFDYNRASDSRATKIDRILDFVQGHDKIDLSTIDANSALSGNQGFAFVGMAAFSGTAGQLRYRATNTATDIFVDVNGDKIADMQIQLAGNHALSPADFVL